MKTIGLVSVLVGVGVFVVSKISSINSMISFISPKVLSYAGLVLFAVGVAILIANRSSSGSQAEKEVPIYHGKKIVGYRRV